MTILKNKLFAAIFVVFLTPQANAYADDNSLLLSNGAIQEDKNSMVWPLLPNESLHDLARLFYPKNTQMQRLFVQKSLHLNAKDYPSLSAEDRFSTLMSLQVPTPRSLAHTRPIHVHKKPMQQGLKMSYRIKSMQAKVVAGLLQQYENLLLRNNFLKEELAKLNQKLEQLQQKMQNLKLLFDKTLHARQIPQKPEKLRNLDKASAIKAHTATNNQASKQNTVWQDYLRTPWLLSLLGLTLLGLLISAFLKKYKQRKRGHFLGTEVAKPETGNISFDGTWQDTQLLDLDQVTVQNSGVVVKEIENDSEEYVLGVLEEARLLTSVNRYDDAISHLKESIKINPEVSIQPWLYLLEVFKKLDMKEDFENYAMQLHQTFNVMTPLWEERAVAIMVPQSLEEFPHIMEVIYTVWPGEAARTYLRHLINDNRDGERSGFGKAVLDEILVLIALLDVHKNLAE